MQWRSPASLRKIARPGPQYRPWVLRSNVLPLPFLLPSVPAAARSVPAPAATPERPVLRTRVEDPTRIATPPRLEVVARVQAPLPTAAPTLSARAVGAPLPFEVLTRVQIRSAASAPRLSAHAADHAMQHRPGSVRACSLRMPAGPWETRRPPHTKERRQPYSAAMSIVMPRGWVRPGGPAARLLHVHPARCPLIASHLRGGAR